LPDDLIDSVTTSYFWNFENADISADEDLRGLLQLMYDFPEASFYLFLQKGASKTDVLDQVMHAVGDINVVQTELRYFRRPTGARSFMRVRGDNSEFEWVRKMAQTQEYIRFTIRLSERKRREMEVEQHLAAHAAANSNPVLLQPNFNGIGIDLVKTWARFRSWLRQRR
jgi:hypothetical protein